MPLSIIFSPLLLSFFLFFSLLQPLTFATLKSYVVYLGSHSHGLEPAQSDIERVKDSHYELLGSLTESKEKAKEKIFYSYTNNINGFAALLEEEEASALAKHPDVVSVFLNKGKKLHTTRSWNFLGLEADGVVPPYSLWKKARYGEDVIIGNLDTGVWPESKSFSDEGMGPVPSKWRGICQHDTKDGVVCNRKLIGTRYFNKGYAAIAGHLNSSFQTARDSEGHGTHTLSTAAGNFVPGANVLGYGNGTAKGGSPHARAAAYKVCWPPINGSNECFDADILAAFDVAISDGVDVLSVSLGGDPAEFSEDAIAIGSFHAVAKGITVVASAGNSGPSAGTVSNVAPWLITVGASTMDRSFTIYVALGNRKHLKGASLSEKTLPAEKFYPLISAADAKIADQSEEDALLCKPGTLDPTKVKGKILVCLRGENGRVDKGHQALLAGGYGEAVFSYLNFTKEPMAFLSNVRTELATKPAPFMASFSSRGPNIIEESILKPDITAPGVSVIAAFTQATGPSDAEYDKRRTPFNTQSGTSMSCPHVSGVVGLLKTLHPDWSPAAIRSAIMTTATTRDNNGEPILDSTNTRATPFADGAGHVQPNRAADPGLIYDLTVNDFLNFLCNRGYSKKNIQLFSDKPYTCPKSFSLADFNYPSITVTNLNDSITVTRRVKNVGSPGTYKIHIRAPPGVTVSVAPSILNFQKLGEEKTFKVTFKLAPTAVLTDYVFGMLTWGDGKHFVRSPLVVRHY
ncbi:PEPTIDASE S8 [Salix koriyanagi]|uniref:PEPTIDASE S8 n=1 Tax=Salix koriyanagi TaxID=2511006 RepID=A0A9Q0X2E0_9ROSI|nr:PEPTIDASE S8 [Salix koriyanagi]